MGRYDSCWKSKDQLDWVWVFMLLWFVQCKVEPQYIHSRFTKKAEVGCIRARANQFANLFDGHASDFGNTGGLKLGVERADVRVQPAAGSGDSIGRHGIRF